MNDNDPTLHTLPDEAADSPDPENTTAAADQAFAMSDGHEFQGEPLKPFSVRRQFAAQAMGNRLLCGRVTLDESGAYDGMFVDVAALIYLCQCPESDVHLAIRRPNSVMDKALAWAETRGLSVGSSAFIAACELYAKIMGELHNSQFTVGSGEGGGSKNA